MTTTHANPILDWEIIPSYDQITPDDVEPAISALLADSAEELHRLETSEAEQWDELMPAVEKLVDRFGRVWGLVSHLQSVKNSPELREAYQKTQGPVVAFYNQYSQSKPLYEAMMRLRDGAEWASYVDAQKRIVEKGLHDAQLAGVALPDDQRQTFTALSQRLAELSTQFSNNVLDATKAFQLRLTEPEEVAGLPPSLLAMAASAARQAGEEEATAVDGPWLITLDQPSYIPFMQHSQRRDLREKLYRAFITRASDQSTYGQPEWDNLPLIKDILRLRHEQAQLIGFANFAEMSLSSKMAPSVTDVFALLHDLREKSRTAGERDLADIVTLARQSGAPEADDFRPWDTAFWAERLREQKYELNEEELRPYFALPRVLEGMFNLVEMLFDIKVSEADEPVPVWHPDVSFYHVQDAQTGEHLASFFLDPYSRPAEKQGGAWMNVLIGRSTVVTPRTNGQVRHPIAYMCCNQTPPVDDKPSLMTFSEVETMFHEFGHALQHMLTDVDYGMVAGINNVEWDAVEIASQFMENWCYHRPTLLSMARHYETGDPLPDTLIERIQQARTFRAGYAMLRQVNFGLFDMTLHALYDPENPEDPTAVQQRIAHETLILPPIEEDRFMCGFGHLFAGGYAAGYYSYKWAEVLSADAFAAFEEVGLDDDTAVRELGRRFRHTILALGGSQHPLEVYKAFRGRLATTEALLRHNNLLNE